MSDRSAAPPPALTIRTARAEDIPVIDAIARSMTLGRAETGDSFLVSNFSRADYEAFLKHKDVTFLVAAGPGDSPRAFLIAYGCAYARTLPDDRSEAVILAAVGAECDFLVIKQVGVDPEARGQGLARRLYRRLFSMRPADFAFAAIVEKPVANTGSKTFHAKLGFTPVLQASPSNDNYGDAIINTIWARQLRPPVHLPPAAEALAPEAWLENLEHARDLYKHEDELNWTKISLLLTVTFALLTAAWILLSEPASLLVLIAKVILVAIGFVTLAAVREKIRSGVLFMASHKTAARLMEGALSMRYTGFVAPLWHVPLKSNTSRWVSRLPGFALGVWTFASAALLTGPGHALWSMASGGGG